MITTTVSFRCAAFDKNDKYQGVCTWLVHSSKLHRFLSTFAPCVIHTPPFLAWLGHPLWLHSFFVAPCVTQTPPFMTPFVTPQGCIFFRLGTMCDAYSSLLDLIVTPLKAASLHLGSMRDTSTSFPSLFVTSLMAASFHLGTMCDANSSLNNTICTTFVATSCLPPYVCLVNCLFEAASLYHPVCTMSETHSSFLPDYSAASLKAAYLLYIYIYLSCLCILEWCFGKRLFLQSMFMYLLLTLSWHRDDWGIIVDIAIHFFLTASAAGRRDQCDNDWWWRWRRWAIA